MEAFEIYKNGKVLLDDRYDDESCYPMPTCPRLWSLDETFDFIVGINGEEWLNEWLDKNIREYTVRDAKKVGVDASPNRSVYDIEFDVTAKQRPDLDEFGIDRLLKQWIAMEIYDAFHNWAGWMTFYEGKDKWEFCYVDE